jgi:MIP family channel proteins
MKGTDARAILAEGLGVFFLVLAGGAAIVSGGTALAVALAFAFTVAVLVYALGHLCGAHFNPAITLAFAATGHFPWRLVPWYAAAQLGGGTVAAYTLLALYGDVGAVATGLSGGLDLWKAFVVEALATAMLALVISGVATDRRASAALGGLAIGLAVGVGSLWGGPLPGGSMNPARSLGPALAAHEWADLWLYLTAPFVGAALGMAAYELLRGGGRPSAGRRNLFAVASRVGGMAHATMTLRRATAGDEAAVLALLRSHEGLEADFLAAEFCLAADGSGVLACGRLRRHGDGALELASVATRAGLHGRGLGSTLVTCILEGVREPVYALALAPGFFAKHGFAEVAKASLPASVLAKADGMCASRPYIAMRREPR